MTTEQHPGLTVEDWAGMYQVAADRADTFEAETKHLRATLARVQAQTDRWRRWTEALAAAPGSDRSTSISLRDVIADLDHALYGEVGDPDHELADRYAREGDHR